MSGIATLSSVEILMPRPRPFLWLREHERSADAILAVVVTAIMVIFHVLDLDPESDYRDPSWWTLPFVIASTFPILWRRTNPIPSALVVISAQIVSALLDIDDSFVGVLIVAYSLGAHTAGRSRTSAVAAIATALGLLFLAGLAVGELDISTLISTPVVLVTAFVLGDNLRQRRDKAIELVERAERAEREQVLIAEQQVNAERGRIARELHDVVAHSVSVMVINAAAARRNLASSPEVAATALTNIEETGRQTMNELRGILGVLRANVDGSAPLAPPPKLTDLHLLVTAADDLPIDLHVAGRLDDLAPSVTLTGYRIVQEALTNIRRHGGPVTTVVLRVVRTESTLEVTVTDDGRGAAADDREAGFGVVGMRERVGALGGTVSAAPRGGGGWRVHMTLPLGTVLRLDPAALAADRADHLPETSTPPRRDSAVAAGITLQAGQGR